MREPLLHQQSSVLRLAKDLVDNEIKGWQVWRGGEREGHGEKGRPKVIVAGGRIAEIKGW